MCALLFVTTRLCEVYILQSEAKGSKRGNNEMKWNCVSFYMCVCEESLHEQQLLCPLSVLVIAPRSRALKTCVCVCVGR